MSNLQIIGILALIIQLVANFPYIWGIVRGGIRPNRVSFFIFALLAIIAYISQAASGATFSNLVTLGLAFNCSLIFLLSLWRGQGGLNRFDLTCLLFAVMGVIGWKLSNIPVVATISVVIADAMGLIPTIKKTYFAPDTEGALAWGMVTVAALFSLSTAIGQNWSIWLFPLYSVLGNGTETILIIYRRQILKNS